MKRFRRFMAGLVLAVVGLFAFPSQSEAACAHCYDADCRPYIIIGWICVDYGTYCIDWPPQCF
jgi:hypothetical protein